MKGQEIPDKDLITIEKMTDDIIIGLFGSGD